MSRVRSPNYPQISLPEAIRRVDQIRAKEGRNAASREALAKLLGFGSLNGASGSVLSAISKYGLLEDAGDKELRVSDLADAILFPHESSEKVSAIAKAANKPALFAEIDEKWPDRPPTDENLRSYLMRRGFSQGALDNVITCYRETMQLVTSGLDGYDSPDMQSTRRPPSMPPKPHPTQHRRETLKTHETIFTPPSGEPFKVSYTPGGIEISGTLTSLERADELIQAIQALKVLLKRMDEVPLAEQVETDSLADQKQPRASVSLMITLQQKQALKEHGYTDEQIREMKPEDAHRVLGIVN
jgi:hypothetical protein